MVAPTKLAKRCHTAKSFVHFFAFLPIIRCSSAVGARCLRDSRLSFSFTKRNPSGKSPISLWASPLHSSPFSRAYSFVSIKLPDNKVKPVLRLVLPFSHAVHTFMDDFLLFLHIIWTSFVKTPTFSARLLLLWDKRCTFVM